MTNCEETDALAVSICRQNHDLYLTLIKCISFLKLKTRGTQNANPGLQSQSPVLCTANHPPQLSHYDFYAVYKNVTLPWISQ